MPLSTTQYGFIIDPMVPFTDASGTTIRNGYVRVFVAGSSTPVLTYKNYDGATNEETIQLDNSGRTAYPVIVSKGNTYKVCVYDAEHSQESPILTIDKVVPAGANVEATNIVTGLDNVESPEAGWVKSTVSGTDAEVSLDATNVTSEVDTMVKATAASADYMMPLVHKTGSDPDKKITLGNIFKFVLNFIHSLTDTATEADLTSGNYLALDGSAGTKKLNSTTLLTKTAQNALAGNVAPAFDPTRTSLNPYKAGESVAYGGKTYTFKVEHYGAWNSSNVIQNNVTDWLLKKADKVILENLMSEPYSSNILRPQPSQHIEKTSYTSSSILCTILDVTATSRLNYMYKFGSNFVSGHKYYISCDVKPSMISYAKIYMGDGYGEIEVVKKNVWSRISSSKVVNTDTEVGVYVNGTNYSMAGVTIEFKNLFIVDLTSVFGAGKEPTKEYIDFFLLGKDIAPSGKIEIPCIVDIYNKGAVTFCDKNAKVGFGDVVCNGFADDVKINNYITKYSPSSITFKSGSNFNVSAPIKVKSGQHIIGYGAKITMADVSDFEFSSLLRASNGVDWILRWVRTNDNAEAISKFYNGVYVEMVHNDATIGDASSHVVAVIMNSSESTSGANGQFRLNNHEGVASWANQAGSKVRTVSSVFDATSVENVVFEGIECDLNVANNPQCFNTFDCQNGATVYLSTGVKFENCNFHDGGRHGILLSSSTHCIIDKCSLDNWGEHGIDLAWHTYSENPPECHHIVTNTKSTNNTLCGIQMHRGSNCIVRGNFTSLNGGYGISVTERGHDNVIVDNISDGDDRGFQAINNVHDCIYSGNRVKNAAKDGVIVENAYNITIRNNHITDSEWNGIRVTSGSYAVSVSCNYVNDSKCNFSGQRIGDIQVNNSSKNCVSGNFVKNDLFTAINGIEETGTSDSNSFVSNTVFGWGDAVGVVGSNSVQLSNVHI